MPGRSEGLGFDRPRSMDIALDALTHNYAQLRARVGPDVRIIPALKANAYGHGIAEIARRLASRDVHSLATGSLEDALAIRAAGVNLPILLYGGMLPHGLPTLVEHGLTPTIYNLEGAEAVAHASSEPTAVYVKVDGGHGRLGVPLEDARRFISNVASFGRLEVAGVYTHLAYFDAAGKDWVRERLAAFDDLLESLEASGITVPVTQALSSSGIVGGLTSAANAVSPGSLLYGVTSVAPDLVDMSAYRPVLKRIRTRLIHVGPMTQRPWVGVVPLGLADGYRDVVRGQTAYALVDGQRAPVSAESRSSTSRSTSRVSGVPVWATKSCCSV